MSKENQFERDPYIEVTSMSAKDAREFIGGSWFKTICIGQDTRPEKKFGARVYRLFKTEDDYKRYKGNKNEK